MKKIRFRLVFNKKKAFCKNKLEEVKIEAVQNSKSIHFSTNVYLYGYQWDENASEIINHPNGETLNRFLQEELIRLEWKELQYWKQGKRFSLKDIDDMLGTCNEEKLSFTEFCKEYISKSNKKETTKNNLMTTVKILESFSDEKQMNKIDYNFMVEFENFLQCKNYKVNTITKHIKHIKSFYMEAVTRNLIISSDDNVYHYKTRNDKYKYSFLIPEELEKLENVNLDNGYYRLQHSLDAFLFCCYTGLRYSDFRSLNADSIVRIDNNEWIVFKSVKTNVDTRLPLYLLFQGKASAILDKYRRDINSFFRIKANSSVDKDLIMIKKLSGINTHISFHTARHTNATLLIYKGVNITTVQKLLGHKSIKTTQHYIDILPEGIINDLKRGFAK